MSVFNNADCVDRAVEGILQQTYREFEFVIVDDGSNDESRQILDRYAAADPRIRLTSQPNAGLTEALVRGCTLASGGFIARQDADDFSHTERLAKQVALLDSSDEIGFVSCWTQYVGPENEPLETQTRPQMPAEATRRLLDDRVGPPAHGSVMFRTSLYQDVGGYRPEFYFGQDSDLWLRMAEKSQIAYVPQVLYQARRDIWGVSGTLRPIQRKFGELGQACRRRRSEGRKETEFLQQARQLTEGFITERTAGRLKVGYATEMAYAIGSRLARNGDRRATKYLWNVICRRPWHWRAWARLLQASCPIKKSRRAETTSSRGPSGRVLGEGQESCEEQPQGDRLDDG